MSSKLSKRKRLLLKWLLIDEIEDDEILLHNYGMKRAKKLRLFELKSEEGLYQKLINNHLRKDHKKFSEFFRLSVEQFDFVLELIKHDIYKKSYNRNLYPVTPDEKLAITMR